LRSILTGGCGLFWTSRGRGCGEGVGANVGGRTRARSEWETVVEGEVPEFGRVADVSVGVVRGHDVVLDDV
jgi:hypothetical protein